MIEHRGWTAFGYARIGDYCRERFGRSGRWLRDQASLWKALDSFPALRRAFDGGDGGRPVGKVAAISIGRVATQASVPAWIELARTVCVRDLKAAVARALESSSHWPRAVAENGGTPVPGVRDEVGHAGGNAGDDGATRRSDPIAPATDQTAPDVVDDDRQLVTMPAPAALRVSFDETLALYRAVSGHDATVTSFVEGLVAEAQAGARPPDIAAVSLRRVRGEAVVERALARSAERWACLQWRCYADPSPCADGDRSKGIAEVLARFEAIRSRAGIGGTIELDGQIRALIDLEDELERWLGRLLCEMGERGGWARLMFAGVRHYAEERLGMGRTAVEGRTRLARALQRFPRLRAAYERGEIGLESAVLIVRVLGREPVDAETEIAWVRHATEVTVKRLRDEARVLGRRRVADGSVGSPGPLEDADWQRSLLQRPGDIRARVHRLGDRAAAAGYSDVFLRLRLPADLARDFLASVEAVRRELAAEARRVPWDQPWPDRLAPASARIARAFFVRSRRLPSWVGLLALLEDFVDTWDDPRAAPGRRAQDVYSRDGWRCSAPGCTSRRNLEDHHLLYRSRGGDRRGLFNRVCLCRFHHARGEHGTLASCRGEAPLNVVWRLGREEVGVWFRNERRLPGRDRAVVKPRMVGRTKDPASPRGPHCHRRRASTPASGLELPPDGAGRYYHIWSL